MTFSLKKGTIWKVMHWSSRCAVGGRPDGVRAPREPVQLPVPDRRRRLDVREPGLLVQGHLARRAMHTVTVNAMQQSFNQNK